ncbi:unnamed protein product [Cylindrotheca closterium]|uniref:Helicase-associated domain-containing protein n=1 Tax=Cylindrotheca closterium TaxID=2856 RepID=A0AAD2FFR3_9STRA|nr:unnamed protein product [Cylindrotheca closterium]
MFLLSYQLDRTVALQQKNPVISLSSRHQMPFQRPTAYRWSTAVDETAMSEETHVAPYDDWDEQFEQLLSFKAKYGHCNFPKNAPTELTTEFPTLAIFCQHQRTEFHHRSKSIQGRMALSTFDRNVRFRKLEEIGFELYGNLAGWHNKYHELVEYHRRNGNVRVGLHEDSSLCKWVIDQRAKRTKGKLSEIQIVLLNNVGFEWESEFADEVWNANYMKLVEFRKKHGNCHVDARGQLYSWIDHQRQRRAKKKLRASLSDKQIQLLDDIEFPWIPNRHEERWYAQYNRLVRFQKDHGHSDPARSTHNKLQDWVIFQRTKRERGQVSKEQIDLLDKVGFSWESKTCAWSEMYRKLAEYYDDKGHLRVDTDDHQNLYDWMNVQRKRYHGIMIPTLTDICIEKLEEISFCWSLDGKDRAWHEKYTEAVEFYKEHGHIRVTEKNNPSLYNWIEMQGKRYKEIKGHRPLSEKELELLEQIDFPFFEKLPRLAWSEMYSKIMKYQKENDGRFPTSHKDDPDLNCWMRQQRNRVRSAYGYVPLSLEERSLLESIGCPLLHRGTQLRSWYEKYDQMLNFQQEHGHFLVSKKQNQSLWRWRQTQRARYHRTDLRGLVLLKSQRYLLERIDFPWTSDYREVEWQMQYDELVRFSEEHGHVRVGDLEEPQLRRWLEYQRQKYKGNGSTELSEHQLEQLQKIGVFCSDSGKG